MKQDLKDRPFKLPWLPLALLLWFGPPLVCKCSIPHFFFFTHLRPTWTLHFRAKKNHKSTRTWKDGSIFQFSALDLILLAANFLVSQEMISYLSPFPPKKKKKKEILHCYTSNLFMSHLNRQYRSRLFTARGSGFWENFRLAVKAVIWKLHGLITPLVIYKVRAVSTVCAVTWFLFRWKEQYAEDLIKLRPRDEVSEIFWWCCCCRLYGIQITTAPTSVHWKSNAFIL